MKNNVLIIYWLTPLTIVSFISSLCLNGIYYDLSLAVFGSSLLSLIIGIIGYRIERKRALERFYLSVKKRVRFWSVYDNNDNIDKKCKYFIDYYLKDFEDLGTAFAEIFFLFNRFSKKKKYIKEEIFDKCISFSWLISYHYWHFKWYLDGSGKNDKVISEFIDEIEDEMLNIKKGYCEPKITSELMEELNNGYYIIMYGKRQYNNELKGLLKDDTNLNK